MSGGVRRAVTASAGTGKAPLFLETGKRYPSTSVIYSMISSWSHVCPIVQHLVVQNGSSEKYSACKTTTNKVSLIPAINSANSK